MAQPTTPKQKKIVYNNLYAPVRTRSVDGKTIPVRQVFKREKYTISDVNGTDEAIFFEPKVDGQEGVIKLFPGQKYGNLNMMLLGNGLIERIEVNIYNPNGLPFDFHQRDATGAILIDTDPASPTFNKEIGAWAKLKELRKVMRETLILHRMNGQDIPIEDKIDNYIHAPHIDEKSGRETSMYTRYSSSSRDHRLGRVLGIELVSPNVYKFAIKGSALLKNKMLSGCEIVVEALVYEDQQV